MTARPMTERALSDEEWAAMTDEQWLQHRIARCAAEGWTANKERYERLLSTSAAVRGMREALEPFAKIAEWYHDSEDSHHEIWVDAHERGTRVTLGMCKAALAALSGIEGEDEQATRASSEGSATAPTDRLQSKESSQ